MFGILAQVSQNVSPANWGFAVNRIGMTISATWLIAWPAIIFVTVLCVVACKYISLRRSIAKVPG